MLVRQVFIAIEMSSGTQYQPGELSFFVQNIAAELSLIKDVVRGKDIDINSHCQALKSDNHHSVTGLFSVTAWLWSIGGSAVQAVLESGTRGRN